MFFVQDLENVPNWQSNWEIRVDWPGSLISEPKTRPIAPFKSYWTNQFPTKIKIDANKSPPSQYYLQPFFLFSLFPQHSLKIGKVLKLYPGFQFFNLNFQERSFFLSLKVAKFNLLWGMSINDNFKKGCSINREGISVFEPPNYYHLPISKTKDLLSFEEINGIRRYDDALFNFKKPLLIPINCLKTTKQNHINFWWSAQNEKNEFISNLTAIKISFYYPKEIKINLELQKNQETKIKIHYWYLITTKLGQKTKIIPITNELINLKSHVANSYQNNYPFDSLWAIKHHSIQTTLTKWKLLLQYFDFKYLKDDLTKILNWHQLPLNITTTTNSFDSSQKQVLKGNMILLSKVLQKIFLTISDFPNQHEFSKTLLYFQSLYQHIFQTKNNWDFVKQKFIIDPLAKTTFLTNWTNYLNEIILFSTLNLNTIIPIKILLKQNSSITNIFFHENLKLKKISTQPQTIYLNKSNQFLIPIHLLKEIVSSLWTFPKYWKLKIKMQNNYVEKDS